MAMAPGALPRPGRVPEQRLLSPETWFGDDDGYGTFRGRRVIRNGVFRSEGSYRRRGDARGCTGCPYHPQARPGLGPRLGLVWLPRGTSPSPLLTPGVFWYIRISVIFPEFSEHFQFWTFSAVNRHNKQKLALWHLLIGQSNKCHKMMQSAHKTQRNWCKTSMEHQKLQIRLRRITT